MTSEAGDAVHSAQSPRLPVCDETRGGVVPQSPLPPVSRATRVLWVFNLVLAYLLSPLPMSVALDLLPFSIAAPLHSLLKPAYEPLNWLSNQSPKVKAFYHWYEGLMDA